MSDLSQTTNFSMDQILDKYLSLKDHIDELGKQQAAAMKPFKTALETLEKFLLDHSIKTGQTQFGTPRATAFQTTKTYCGVESWDQVMGKMIHDALLAIQDKGLTVIDIDELAAVEIMYKSGAFNMLNHAINKTAVKEHMDENQGVPPPGVKWSSERVIQIRRKEEKTKGAKSDE